MASPVVESNSSAVELTANVREVTVTAPSGIVDGDLLVAVAVFGSDTTAATCTGFTELTSNTHGTGGAITVLYKYASSESGDYLLTGAGSNTRCVGSVSRISGVHATVPFVGTTPTWASGAGVNPDPPASATVTSADYLFLAVCAQEGAGATRYTAPTSYTEQVDIGTTGGGGGAGHDSIGVFSRQLTATSDNPGVVTSSVGDDWSANTFIVNPVAAAGDTVSDRLMRGVGT